MQNIDAGSIKTLAGELGAELCGIAPEERFAAAPPGFRPTDIFPGCRSVIVFARRLPVSSIHAPNCIPYTFVNDMVTREVDRMTFRFCRVLEDIGVSAVPIPSDDPYEYWEPENSYGRAILSLRHAGQLAGLGVPGKNNLLINDRFGNMIQLGAVLTDRELTGDPPAEYRGCPAGCELCLKACPVGALDGVTVNQQKCRPLSNFTTGKGYILKKCNACRRVCPCLQGIRRS